MTTATRTEDDVKRDKVGDGGRRRCARTDVAGRVPNFPDDQTLTSAAARLRAYAVLLGSHTVRGTLNQSVASR